MQKKPRIVVKSEENLVLSPEFTKKTETEFLSLLDKVGYPHIHSISSSQEMKTPKREELLSVINTVETALTIAEQNTPKLDQLGKFAEEYLASKKPTLSPAPSYPFPKPSSFQPSINTSKTQEILNVPVGGTWSAFAIQFRKATKNILQEEHLEKKTYSKFSGKVETDSNCEKSDEESLPYYHPRLFKEDANIFGYFPSKEPLVVVKCNHCFKVIKASHFHNHMAHCPRTPDLDVYTMEDLIGKNRNIDKVKKKIPTGKNSKQSSPEEEEEEAIYAPPIKKSKSGGKKTKASHSEGLGEHSKKNKKKEKKASKKKPVVVEAPPPPVPPPTAPPVDNSPVEEEVLEEGGGSPSSYSTVVPPPPLMTVPVTANRLTLRGEQMTPPQMNFNIFNSSEENSVSSTPMQTLPSKKKKLKVSHEALDVSNSEANLRNSQNTEISVGNFINHSSNPNTMSTQINPTRQNSPLLVPPTTTVNNNQMNNKLNVVSINVKTGDQVQRHTVASPPFSTAPNLAFSSPEIVSPDDNKPKTKRSRRRGAEMQKQVNNMQYQGVPASPNSPNIQPPSPGSPMQSPMMNQTKSTQFINKTPNNVSIRPTTPSTFQPASFSYQAQPHGYLPMHSNGSLSQDQKLYVTFSNPQMGYVNNMNGSSASSNMGTHHMHMNPHIVQMSNGHMVAQNGQVFMTSNPYGNPQALHLQRYQVPTTQGVNKQQQMNVYGQGMGVNGMGVYPMLQKQETDNLTGMNYANVVMNNNNTHQQSS